MNTYETLLQEAASSGLYVVERASFESDASGLIVDDIIGLNKNIDTDTERACVLAEELGHHYTTSGCILDQEDTSNRKQERIARLWSYNKLIGLHGIIESYKRRCLSRYDMAKFLGVTDSFLDEAIATYAEKYGPYIQIDNYVILFKPCLAVMELIA